MKKIILFTLLNGLLCNLPFSSQAYPWLQNTDHIQTKLYEDFSACELNRNIWNNSSNAINDTTGFVFNVISFALGMNFAHYFPTNNAKGLNWDTPPLNLGGEVLISYKLSERTSLISGFNYQYGKIALKNINYGDITKFHEISIPVIGDCYAFSLFKTNLHFKTGLYMGKYFKIKRETKGGKLSPDSNKWDDYPLNNNSQNFICDYYLSLRNKPITTKNPIYFELFLKYRLNNHWLNDDVSKFMYGIKIIKHLNIVK